MAKRSENQDLFNLEKPAKPQGPVECLGMTFKNDEARREHFLSLLREALKELHAKLGGVPFTTVEDAIQRLKSLEHWPVGDDDRIRELAERMSAASRASGHGSNDSRRATRDLLTLYKEEVGFPYGEIEDILNLSDPPYYTACPNPFIADFIKHYGKPYDPSKPYTREPFAADVSEGKNDPIYNAHSYHTKVPHKAIMRYILHYTEPGDVVFDGFCGTGMTGVAAQMCGDKAVVESLGYRVDKDGTISQQETDENGKTIWKPFSKLGARRAVLNDLSPAATFIAYNYNTPVDVQAFEREAKRILKEVEEECGWMYETLHTDGKTKGKINFTVWSDVFVCLDCTREVVFWEAAVDKAAGKVNDEFPCPYCSARLTKRNMDRAWVTRYDKAIGQTIRQAKQVPVLINYTVGGKRAEKTPDAFDWALIEKIENSDIPYWFPTNRMMEGAESRRNDPIGITHVHHFYTKRNLWVLGALLPKSYSLSLKLIITGILQISSKQSSFRYDSRNPQNTAGGILKGTLYVPSIPREGSVFENYKRRMNSIVSGLTSVQASGYSVCAGTASLERLFLSENSLDYCFVDPPFGSNINYSELNTTWESWLKVWTNNKPEAIENSVQKKGPNEYRQLMTACFKEAYRVLKPGRWMTVEFSNTKASVWNSIQTAITEAGFIVANVSALDKKQGSFKAVTTPTAVKQDLVISAYKPNGGFEERFLKEAQTEEGVWDFVRTHLKYLPVVKRGASASHLIAVTERDPRILYDQMVAYYVRKGYPVPLNSSEFQEGLSQRFSYRDGMYFLPHQVAEYDKKKMASGGMEQGSLFVSDESSAIAWLRQLLKDKPQTFQDIHPLFIKELGGWQKHEKPLELSDLLEQNFLRYDGKGEVPNQIHSYLSTNFKELRNLPKDDERLRAKGKDRWYVPDPNKAGDLEKLRERSLLKEFEDYRTSSQKRLKVFRLEAVRAGFKKAWAERDYATIIAVARKIPENVLQEDPKLLMWYDQALTRMGGEL
jgi:DNA modification methylase/DNA-directed RNA polymerase subunit RPC12/RpoP